MIHLSTWGPSDLLTNLQTGAGIVLPWIGAAVAAAVVLFFAFLGIRRGFRFFRELAEDGFHRRNGGVRWSDDWDTD